MKVLVVGGGGREHAIVWKLSLSKKVDKIYCAPGNGGTSKIAENVPIKADDIKGLIEFSLLKKIDLTIIGPEAPLAAGVVDAFIEKGLKVFGPSKDASQLEASKIFTKKLCEEKNIPTAWFKTFRDAKKAKEFVKEKKVPIVIKADGLAAGKGVIVAKTEKEAFDAIDNIIVEKAFGDSGKEIIVEEFLEGEEASILVISDGENIVPLVSSQDHKRIYEGDKGPNTGGMGAYSPAPVVTDKIFDYTISKIIEPTILGMKEKGFPFKGVLYAGIMITKDGPKLLEFNVRFGDPETQVILPRMKSDLFDLLNNAALGKLANYKLEWEEKNAVCVVLASGGYPGKYEKGKIIAGLKETENLKDILVFHAGTKINDNVITDGGRVVNVVALGNDIESAIKKAYEACSIIKFEKMIYRKDIGSKAIKH
jgi:phosphoribosylamine---glycine ligase